jgi:hypothetical protein
MCPYCSWVYKRSTADGSRALRSRFDSAFKTDPMSNSAFNLGPDPNRGEY